jgi:hypothetical protein
MLPEGLLKLHIVFTMLLNDHVLSPSEGVSSNSDNYYLTVGSKDEAHIKFDLTFSNTTHKCGQSNKPFQPASFIQAEATPGRDNRLVCHPLSSRSFPNYVCSAETR